jgi:hypothetical protein
MMIAAPMAYTGNLDGVLSYRASRRDILVSIHEPVVIEPCSFRDRLAWTMALFGSLVLLIALVG